MSEIKVKKPSQEELDSMGVDGWSPWECEPSTFDWEYSTKETAYVLEGRVRVRTDAGEVEFGQGDLVTFPKGMKCKWNVIEKIRKVYKFGD
ncbi:MAG: cupin domain-containing protein [Deltaproteobacteria bacterium]|nr:cupin domain-containing protein [Deltaproteobacteria bacterium]